MPSALREQLLAQVQNHPIPPHRPEHQLSTASNPHHHNIDPAIASAVMMNSGGGDSGGDENGSDGRKGSKRELSTSKRAAQNRAAQVCSACLSVVCVGKRSNLRLNFSLREFGDTNGLLNDYYSAPSGSAKKAISKLSRTRSESSIISTKITSRCSQKIINYGTTSSAFSHACSSPRVNILNHHQISTFHIPKRPARLHKTRHRLLLWVPQRQTNYVRNSRFLSSTKRFVLRYRMCSIQI